jgi:L-cystine uptake protein TcyP (sodium:dicarboxylate symporter family)
MSLTNRILLAMVLGIGLGSVLEVVLGSLSQDSGLTVFCTTAWSWACFDVLGRIFIASLKLLVVPLVLVSSDLRHGSPRCQ